MNIRRGLSAILGLVLIETPFLEGKEAPQDGRPHMILLVCDQVGIGAENRLAARTQTVRIFGAVDVEVVWIETIGNSRPCSIAGLDRYFTLVISPRAPRGWTTVDAMGFAPLRTGPRPRAYIFFDQVKIFLVSFNTQNLKTAAGIVLGHAIAHELGHVLIPGEAHGRGIMSPGWSYREWDKR